MNKTLLLLGLVVSCCFAQESAPGFLTTLPDRALAPLMAEQHTGLSGRLIEGQVWDVISNQPLQGVMIYDTVTAAVAMTDQYGCFRLLGLNPHSFRAIRLRQNQLEGLIQIDSTSPNTRLFRYYRSSACGHYQQLDTGIKGSEYLSRCQRRYRKLNDPAPSVQWWYLSFQRNTDLRAEGIVAMYDSAGMTASPFQRVLNRRQLGIWQGWGDEQLWKDELIQTWLLALETEYTAVSDQITCMASGEDDESVLADNIVSNSYDQTIVIDISRKNIKSIDFQEFLYVDTYDYALDRHDLIHQYPPQYDSVRQEWFLRTDSITWYYHKIGKYNWPALFSLTSVRTGLAPDGTSLCTDTLYATLKLVHLSEGPPAPEVRRQMVDLLHLPAAFPPVKEEFRKKYWIKP